MVSILIRWKMALERYTLREIFDKCNSMGTVKYVYLGDGPRNGPAPRALFSRASGSHRRRLARAGSAT